MTPTKVKRKGRFMLKLIKGGLIPADDYTAGELREKNWKIGDIIAADLTKCRNPRFNRLAHRIGMLCVEHIDDFNNLDAHNVLKRIQLEANIGCQSIAYKLEGYGMIEQRIPQSLSFDNMDEIEFQDVVKKICLHISNKYWHTLTPEQIEEMAETFVNQ
jgi:hypothetical protein